MIKHCSLEKFMPVLTGRHNLKSVQQTFRRLLVQKFLWMSKFAVASTHIYNFWFDLIKSREADIELI